MATAPMAPPPVAPPESGPEVYGWILQAAPSGSWWRSCESAAEQPFSAAWGWTVDSRWEGPPLGERWHGATGVVAVEKTLATSASGEWLLVQTATGLELLGATRLPVSLPAPPLGESPQPGHFVVADDGPTLVALTLLSPEEAPLPAERATQFAVRRWRGPAGPWELLLRTKGTPTNLRMERDFVVLDGYWSSDGPRWRQARSAPQPSPCDRRGSYRAPADQRFGPTRRRVFHLTTKEEVLPGRDLLVPWGSHWLARAPNGALVAGPSARPILPAACEGRIVDGAPERSAYLVTCKVKGEYRSEAWFLSPRRTQRLDLRIAPVSSAIWPETRERFLPFYPGVVATLLDLETGKVHELGAGVEVLATDGAGAWIRREGSLLRWNLGQPELRRVAAVAPRGKVLQSGRYLYVEPVLIDGNDAEPRSLRTPPAALRNDGTLLVPRTGVGEESEVVAARTGESRDLTGPPLERGPWHWSPPSTDGIWSGTDLSRPPSP